ncbi:STAS domain-containing protein [Saccharothrix luteola]|uniref:STAS domain-containing protein n=1 Tax=Saccharothrix luteola TaxID=2893018 RepID=UPI001E3A8FE9|nr:STAS domain-containing protein [Saccharothrix luteola]MCC8249486.1 STAS domain-containing protein [Saccharothrix luteola]
MLALSVEAHRTGCAVVVATGELDLAGARRVLDRMDRLVSEGRDRIVLDMSGVAFCGAQAMSALVRTRARAQRAGGWLRLAAVPPHVRRVFERTDLDRLFPRYPDVASAATGRAVASGEERGAVGGVAGGAVDGVAGGAVDGRPVDGRAVAGGAAGGGAVARDGRSVARGGRVSRGGRAASGAGEGPGADEGPVSAG